MMKKDLLRKGDVKEKKSPMVRMDLDKASVVQAVKIFNNVNVSPGECVMVLTRLIFIIQQGHTLSSDEATSAFFDITKLFQFKNPVLRRLCHVSIKLLSGMANDIIIATSSLMRDMNGDDAFTRASAIRALCSIIDVSNLAGVERYIKQAIVDRNNNVASAALVSSLRFAQASPDTIKRWLNEIAEICLGDPCMCQYHALGLWYLVKQHDRLAVVKMVSKYSRTTTKVMPSAILCIRIALATLEGSSDQSERKELLEYLESCFHHRSDAVVCEACLAFISLKGPPIKYLVQTVSVLRVFLASPRMVVRYSAVSALSGMSSLYPELISECSLDLESLLSDSNKSLATHAVTALLKVGSDSNVERIIKIVSSFISEISEPFRVIIVKELRVLVVKYPKKAQVFLSFIASMLRETGRLAYKRDLVELVITVVNENPEEYESGLLLLCEFIEDCEHSDLTIRALGILAEKGHCVANPSQFVRYVCNRISLDTHEVRSAAIACLAKFGVELPALRPSILVLIRRCFYDFDDDVRDRAVFYHTYLQRCDEEARRVILNKGVGFDTSAWLKALNSYLSNEDHSQPFDVNTVVSVTEETPKTRIKPTLVGAIFDVPAPKPHLTYCTREEVVKIVVSHELCNYSHVAEAFRLTETDAELGITCYKHMFSCGVVFEFVVENTLDGKTLQNVSVRMVVPEEYSLLDSKTCDSIDQNQSGKCFSILSLPDDPGQFCGMFPTTMRYTLKSALIDDCVDVSDGGVEDEYQVDSAELLVADHLKPVSVGDFDMAWDRMPEDCELSETCILDSFTDIKEAEEAIVKLTGLMVDVSAGLSSKRDTRSHSMKLCGRYRNGEEVLARIDFRLGLKSSIKLCIRIRCGNAIVSENILSVFS